MRKGVRKGTRAVEEINDGGHERMGWDGVRWHVTGWDGTGWDG